ncbi:peptidase associated/transthyretin-like domain-containing protein [Myroides sp. LJL116]
MKKIYYLLSLCIIGLILACNNQSTKNKENKDILTTNLDGTITIKGRVLVQETNQPPKGINTINISNKWKFEIKERGVKGENQRVYLDKNGYYQITIEKGDTMQFIANNIIYKQSLIHYKVADFTKNSTINFTVKTDSTPYLDGISKFPQAKPLLDKFLNDTDPEKTFNFSGTIINKETNKPINGLPIFINYHQNTIGTTAHHLTNEQGEFKLNVPYNTLLRFSASNSPNRTQKIYVTKDTIANILF